MSIDYWPGSSSVRKLSKITYFLSAKSRNLENIFSSFLMRIERENWIIPDLAVGCHTFINILIHFSIERENLNSLKYFPSLLFFLSRTISSYFMTHKIIFYICWSGHLWFGKLFDFGFLLFFKKFINLFNWRWITLQYCSAFCHTFTWISHGCTCVPHPGPLPTSLLIPSPRVIPVH